MEKSFPLKMECLPNEIRVKIFDYLDIKTKKNMCLTCKSWMNLVRAGPKPFGNVEIPHCITEIHLNDFLLRWISVNQLHIQFSNSSDEEKEEYLRKIDFSICPFLEKVFINGHFFQDLNPIRKVGQEGLIFQLKFDPRIEEDQIISMKNVHQIQICYSALSSAYAFKKAIELLVEADLKNCHELGIRMGDYSSKFFNNTTILILTEIFLKRYQSNFKKLTFDNPGLGDSHTNHYILDTAKFDSLESLKIHNLDSINRLDEFLITHPKVTSLHLHTFDFPLKILQHENNYYKKN